MLWRKVFWIWTKYLIERRQERNTERRLAVRMDLRWWRRTRHTDRPMYSMSVSISPSTFLCLCGPSHLSSHLALCVSAVLLKCLSHLSFCTQTHKRAHTPRLLCLPRAVWSEPLGSLFCVTHHSRFQQMWSNGWRTLMPCCLNWNRQHYTIRHRRPHYWISIYVRNGGWDWCLHAIFMLMFYQYSGHLSTTMKIMYAYWILFMSYYNSAKKLLDSSTVECFTHSYLHVCVERWNSMNYKKCNNESSVMVSELLTSLRSSSLFCNAGLSW